MTQSKDIGEKILKQTPFGVRVEGVDVVMTVGTKCCRMDYNTALKLGMFLRNGARTAKRNAGDSSQAWQVFADLTDKNLDDLNAERSRDGTAVFHRK